MRSTSSKFLCLATLLISTNVTLMVRADVNKVGNGGNAVVCSEDKEQVRLLDLYEMKDAKDLLVVGTADTPAPYEKIVDTVIDRIAQTSPKLGAAYRNRWKEFPTQVEWVTGKKLTKVDDSLHSEEPLSETCKIVQLAIRLDKTDEGDKRFHIRKDLWDSMTSTGQAALVMHELLYQHLSRLGEKDSRSVRQINRLLFSKNYDSKKFWKLVKSLRVPIYPD